MRHPFPHPFLRRHALTLMLLASLLPAGSQAVNLGLYPTRVQLDRAHNIETLLLSNDEDRPLSFEVRAFRWQMREDGSWEQTPSTDLIVQPLIVTMPAKSQGRVRVGTLSPDVTAEQAYRLELQELPGAAAVGGAQITVLTKFSIPVFVSPADHAPQPVLQAVKLEGDDLDLRVGNPGTGYLAAQPGQLQVLAADGTALYTGDIHIAYVLAGASLPQHWEVPASICGRAASVRLKLEEMEQALEMPISAASRQCRR